MSVLIAQHRPNIWSVATAASSWVARHFVPLNAKKWHHQKSHGEIKEGYQRSFHTNFQGPSLKYAHAPWKNPNCPPLLDKWYISE